MLNRRKKTPQTKFFEVLESRQLLSGTPQINFPNFSSTTGLVTNGYGGGATTVSNDLQLTDGQLGEARSAIDSTLVPINTFTAHFTFQITAGTVAGSDGTSEADGVAFVIDNGTTADLGSDGVDLGYSNGTFGANSVAIEFNTYNLGSFGSTVGFAQGGTPPSSTAAAGSVDFHSGDVINATVTYDGTTLTVALADATAGTSYTTSEAINLTTVLNGQTAFVGFSGATGGDESIQTINEFDYTGSGGAPTVTSVAASSPVIVTGTKAHLSVSATSNSGGTLSYNWTLLHKPSGAATPTFTANNSGTANDTIAHFFKAGTYIFRSTITDSNGGVAVSDVAVVVKQTATQIKMTPHKAQIVEDTTKQFTASMFDQFGHVFYVQPSFTFAIVTGNGSIGASSGLYSAGSTAAHLLVSATADSLTGESGETVIA